MFVLRKRGSTPVEIRFRAQYHGGMTNPPTNNGPTDTPIGQATCPMCGELLPNGTLKCVSCGEAIQQSTSQRKKWLGRGLGFFAALGIGAVLIALFLPAVRSSKPAARRSACKQNLKQIGLALHTYHETYGSLPPAYTVDAEGNRLHSWRTLILPFLDQQALYDQIDLSKPWDDPANWQAYKTALPVFRCPSFDGPAKNSAEEQRRYTTYLASVGPDSCFPLAESRTFGEITDGREQTVMVIEVQTDQAVHWMSPYDADESMFLSFDEKSPTAHSGGVQIALCDGSIRFLPNTVSPQTRRALMTVAGGEPAPDF